MKRILPEGLSAATFETAMQAFRGVVGEDWVFDTDLDRETYLDPYAPGNAESYAASAAIAPASTEEVQAVLRVANEHRIPLWPVSRGKNLGYGTGAPVMAGTVILNLDRMKRILEVDVENGYVLLEPGVSFIDLFNYLQENDIPLWMSGPAHSWGSVVGNALDRGVGYTPYGTHADQICGMEVVLPDGDVVRTGMGAMTGSTAWQLFKYGFGPSWDGMFLQSNFGVVTKMGLWMMPEPEATLSMSFSFKEEDAIGPIVDTLRPLRLKGIIEQNVSIGNIIRNTAVRSTRDQWYQGDGAIPQDILEKIRDELDVGWWSFSVRLFGYDAVNEFHAGLIREAFAPIVDGDIPVSKWKKGDPIERSGAMVPSMQALHIVNWRGGAGGHLTFSPIVPTDGAEAMKQYRLVRNRYEEFGFDYYGGFTPGKRHTNHISMVVYDRHDPDMAESARELFKALVADAHQHGYGEYRTHVNYMDQVARSYDFNNNALLRLNEKVKDALDPNGIIAPGKSGIWPKDRRGTRGEDR